ncbi:efflux RND transporter periplasmic adaptor subunit [Endomicrobium proavitum]|uniref:ABC-type macrolide exporter membrane component n=1 Tax=Endomicrobium proavitum TaxID=1408281 RepID=A0A0G3WKW0_9BACT|nr:efflux RND transporter periplasmic adaptor subunit [Endomicrobium proavitum]AKL98510.1 ABC-type macrolide exporter membrane component [Endomicrobium proavitum]
MKKILIILAVLIVAGVAAYFVFKPAVNAIDKETKLTQRNLSVEFRETGSVSPRNRLEIKPPFGGRIEEILVNEGDNVKKGQILAWMSSSERAAMIDAARAQGQKEYEKWSTIYKPTPVVSPMSGFIILRQKEPGQTVTASEAILVMADDLIVQSNVDETDLRYIKVGGKLKMYLDAYPDEIFDGVVEHISYESTVVSNVTVYMIKIRPVKKPQVFRAGMTATITITAESKENAWSVPNNFITDRNGKKFVNVKKDKNIIESREVQTGITDGRYTEIVSGITQDDTIITVKTAKNKEKSKTFVSGR